MAEVLQKLIVGADGSEKYVPLNAEELAQREFDMAAFAAAEETRLAAEAAEAEAKASAIAKLEANGLTADEIAALIK